MSLGVERCDDLTIGAAGATQLDDASHSLLLGLDRPRVAIASLAGGGIAEGIVAYCLAANGCLREAAVPQALRDHTVVELGEDAHDLTDGGSHRVVGVVSMYLTDCDESTVYVDNRRMCRDVSKCAGSIGSADEPGPLPLPSRD